MLKTLWHKIKNYPLFDRVMGKIAKTFTAEVRKGDTVTIEPLLWGHKHDNGYHVHFGTGQTSMYWKPETRNPWPCLELVISDDHENTVSLRFNIPFIFGLFVSVDYTQWNWVRTFLGRDSTGGRVFGFNTCDEFISLSLYRDDLGYRKRPGWFFLCTWEELLKGSATYLDEVIVGREQHCLDTYPHAGYLTQELTLDVIKKRHVTVYSRWTSKVFYRYEVVADVPSYYQGKSENSWDQGPQEMQELSVPNQHCGYIGAAIQYITHLNDNRNKYG